VLNDSVDWLLKVTNYSGLDCLLPSLKERERRLLILTWYGREAPELRQPFHEKVSPRVLERMGHFSEDLNVVTNHLWNPYSTVEPNSQGLFQRTAFRAAARVQQATGTPNATTMAPEPANSSIYSFSPAPFPDELSPLTSVWVCTAN